VTAPQHPRTIGSEEVADRLRAERQVLVVSHEAPDGDAVGCVVALVLMCERLGVPCMAYIPGEAPFPQEYAFLPRVRDVLRGSAPTVGPDTTVYLLDCASLSRSNSVSFGDGVTRVNIDHHHDNPGYGELNLLDASAPSTTALLYQVFKAGRLPIDVEIAAALYVGLVTDTGRFQYGNTSAAAHRMAAELQDLGVDVTAVYRELYENVPLPKLRLLARALEHLEIRRGGAVAVSWLSDDDFVAVGASEGDAEGIIDTLRQAKDVRAAVLAREQSRDGRVQTKVSLRSVDGSVDVSAVARERGGGGHPQAAGFTAAARLDEVLEWTETQIAAAL
jgi:bifunctional oligoribonuclease and PAP phosphatase NrnA